MRNLLVILLLLMSSLSISKQEIETHPEKRWVEIGDQRLKSYTYKKSPVDGKLELKGVQVPIPKEDRVYNWSGNRCVWSSLETLANFAEYEKLYGITKPVNQGGDPRCQGLSDPAPLRKYLRQENIKYDMIEDKSNTEFLIKYCKEQRRGVAFNVYRHVLILIHYDPETKIVKVIDNMDRSLSVQTWDWDKFHRLWRGWAFVIFREPDLIPYKYNPWRKIPIIDRTENQKTYREDYLPVP